MGKGQKRKQQLEIPIDQSKETCLSKKIKLENEDVLGESKIVRIPLTEGDYVPPWDLPVAMQFASRLNIFCGQQLPNEDGSTSGLNRKNIVYEPYCVMWDRNMFDVIKYRYFNSKNELLQISYTDLVADIFPIFGTGAIDPTGYEQELGKPLGWIDTAKFPTRPPRQRRFVGELHIPCVSRSLDFRWHELTDVLRGKNELSPNDSLDPMRFEVEKITRNEADKSLVIDIKQKDSGRPVSADRFLGCPKAEMKTDGFVRPTIVNRPTDGTLKVELPQGLSELSEKRVLQYVEADKHLFM